jgi:hypothetical protein
MGRAHADAAGPLSRLFLPVIPETRQKHGRNSPETRLKQP